MATAATLLAQARLYLQAGVVAQAEQHYRQALQVDPDCADAHFELGNVLAHHGHFQAAADCYLHVLRLQPGNSEAHSNLGVMLAEQRQYEAALSCYEKAIALRPDYAEAHYNLGNALKELDRMEEAAACYARALKMRPGFAGAHLNRGIALARGGRLADAVADYQEALRLRPDWPEGHNNLGLALAHLGQHDEAVAEYARALQLRPDFADAHYNRALSWLAQGDFERGWPEFEWRWRLDDLPPRRFQQPRWEGSPLAGRAILLHAEQGLGDTIQFIRFARHVKGRDATVLVECQSALIPLLTGVAGVDRLIARGETLPAFDVHFPLMSLGGLYTKNVANIPADIPYLAADAARIEHWRRELNGLPGFKIGIAWQGSRGYRWDRLRSIPLQCFAPLARRPGVTLVSLQKGPGVDQLARTMGFDVVDLGGRLDNDGGAFLDTAAVLASLDLVVTSDTALAHLAGALGRPVWVALALAPEWRWLLDREDSPWYPTMRLFRQTSLGDWEGVFQRIAAALGCD
jgi:tetratricopeptide (TPR) repeat protein